MKPIWSGMITFGLVNIPVELYPATEDNDVAFHFLHAEDNGKLRNQRVCTRCGKTVAYGDTVRGYEFSKGEYVVVSDDDLKNAAPKSSQNIAIEEFVHPDEIDPIYYDRPYYVAVGKKTEKAYALLVKGMEAAGVVGLARVTLRTRERLAALHPDGGKLTLNMMHYHDDIRPADSLPGVDAAVSERELKMAAMLIEGMVGKFEPSKYKDQYEKNLHRVIEERLAGHAGKEDAKRQEATEVIDLVARLKASLDQLEGQKSEKPGHKGADDEPLRRAA